MTSHLTFPYNWENCVERETCQEHVHLPETAEKLNNYPQEWVQVLIGNCVITEQDICFYNAHKKYHNENGPAIISSTTQQWYMFGRLHRTDGPAVHISESRTEWHQNGQLHRVDGPAIIWAEGTKEWYQKNQLHRVDGPAVEYSTGLQEWWHDGVFQNNTWKEELQNLPVKNHDQTHEIEA